MYRAIVSRKVQKTFAELSRGNFDALIDQLAPGFNYRFVGTHALGGERSSAVDVEAWFERVFRLFPNLRFAVQHTAVSGPPWRTVALTHVTVEADNYRNEMFQRIDLAWGKLTGIVTMEDLDALHAHLAHLADQGQTEATAAPITS